jgi:cytochrome c-type protein NapC
VSFFSNRLVKTCVILAVVGVGVVASWATLDTAFHVTGDYEFCTSCHGYEPIALAYREDVHGGNNSVGVMAACNDCHLPHDNSLHYFWVKAKHGIVDPTMALIKEPHEIDWHGIRERREEFVYDSGCLTCHKNLQEATADNRMASRAHRKYFEGKMDKQCVTCHQNVGHNRLGYHLEALGWEKPKEIEQP